MKFTKLKALGHKLADLFASDMNFMIGHWQTEVFIEACAGGSGFTTFSKRKRSEPNASLNFVICVLCWLCVVLVPRCFSQSGSSRVSATGGTCDN